MQWGVLWSTGRGICSDVSGVMVVCFGERNEPKGSIYGKPFYSRPWSQALGNDQKNNITDTGGWMSFLHRVSGLLIRDRVRGLVMYKGLRAELLLRHRRLENLVRFSGHVLAGGDPEEDLWTMFLRWPRKALESPQRFWSKWIWKGKCGSPYPNCCLHNPNLAT